MKKIVLASNSPRRRNLIAGLDLDYEIRLGPDIDESWPEGMPAHRIPEYIATRKAEACRAGIGEDEVLLTADTVVIIGSEVVGKPHDEADARRMLHLLSGRTHHVVTGVCLTTVDDRRCFSVTTDVTFKKLSDEEIDYYLDRYHPLDKAGAYGIQEWIGYVGVTSISGSYFNVMGLPVQRVYSELLDMEGGKW